MTNTLNTPIEALGGLLSDAHDRVSHAARLRRRGQVRRRRRAGARTRMSGGVERQPADRAARDRAVGTGRRRRRRGRGEFRRAKKRQALEAAGKNQPHLVPGDGYESRRRAAAPGAASIVEEIEAAQNAAGSSVITGYYYLSMAEQQFWIGVHGVIEDRGRILRSDARPR